MAAAATKFLARLTPEQRQQATFAFESDERMHWHFIPTEMFPRNGLTVKEMTEPQRKLAHDLLKAGLSQRGYLTATSIMDLETVLGALEAAQRAAAAQPPRDDAARPRSGALLLLGLRHAVGEGHLGLARRRPSRLAALHGRERHAGRGVAVVLRHRTRRKCARVRRRGCGFSAPRRMPRARCSTSLDAAQRAKAIIDATAPSDMLTMANVDITPLSPTGLGADAMTPAQRDLLMKLIDVYTGKMAADIAADGWRG